MLTFKMKLLHSNPYVIPEGGSNLLAVKGVEELVAEIDINFDYICSAV